MRQYLLIAGFVALIGWSPPSHALLSVDERVADAETLVDLYVHHYGPLPWKEAYLDISLPAMTDRLMEGVRAARTDEDFYEALIHFLSGFKDAHVSGIVPSTYRTWLGFTVDAFGDELVIVDINREELSEELFPFALGDRLVAIDGQDPEQVMRSLLPYREMGHAPANRRLTAAMLTSRRQSRVPRVPSGQATVAIYSYAREVLETVTIPWRHEGFPLARFTERPIPPVKAIFALLGGSADALPQKPASFLDQMRALRAPDADGSGTYLPFGNLTPYFPLGATFVERSTDPYYSGIFITPTHRIGFLRLHTWWDIDFPAAIALLEREIPQLQATTDALIIDQTHNPGGDLCFLEEVARFFVAEPKPTVLFQVKPSRLWLQWFEEEALSLPPEWSAKQRKLHALIREKLRTAMEAGSALTEPIPLCSPDGLITPYENAENQVITYTKPKLLLINDMDCSGGDVFPAIIQDAGAATTFGTRTIGCGGNVINIEHIGRSDFTARVTMSLMVRNQDVVAPNGIPTRYIENVGVRPDIHYAITPDDVRNGYRAYREAILRTVGRLIDDAEQMRNDHADAK